MSVNDSLDPYWEDFQQAPEYQRLALYANPLIQHFFAAVSQAIIDSTLPLKQWRKQQLAEQVTDFVTAAGDPPDAIGDVILLGKYRVFAMVMTFLAKRQKLGISAEALPLVWQQLERQYDLDSESSRADEYFLSTLPSSVSGLAQWQSYTAADIADYTQAWVDDYVASAAWRQRPMGVSREFLSTTVADLTTLAYDRYRKTPKTWTKRVLQETLSWKFVWQQPLTATGAALIVPALTAWLAWLGQTERLNAKKAANYQRYLRALEPEFLKQMQDEELFSTGKLLYTHMVAFGIDPNAEAAVDAFMDQVIGYRDEDLMQEVQALMPEAALADQADWEEDFEADESALVPDDVRAILDDEQAMQQAAELYDPDSAANYLQADHLPAKGPRQWQKAVAQQVHAQGVQAGLRLWLQRDRYALPQGWQAPAIVLQVTQLFDLFYAQDLSTPASWTPAMFADFGDWLRQNEAGQALLLLYSSMLAAQAAAGSLPAAQSSSLQAALRGEPMSGAFKAKPGKVISLQQAKAQLKHKPRAER
ncbi:hypothetical protein ACFQ5J_10845 [Lacticaseibacillus baoqingensis]|uniref:Uncharacterized protein n=1 Tax=Lacticaseibacillus baoqingensis TaxID=2486013 RepID=A0ABW4E9B8_9LACO|nr:hypothetical protein [Lacticaseibacillus baoqingensis]